MRRTVLISQYIFIVTIGRILTYEFDEKQEDDRSAKIHEAIPLKIQRSDSFQEVLQI